MEPLNWHTQEETPTQPTSALIAADLSDQDSDAFYCLIGGIYNWSVANQRWEGESTGEPLACDLPYVWITEASLMATINPAAD